MTVHDAQADPILKAHFPEYFPDKHGRPVPVALFDWAVLVVVMVVPLVVAIVGASGIGVLGWRCYRWVRSLFLVD